MQFPNGFLFGSAVAGHQIEGGNFASDWSEWEKLPGKIADSSTTETACDSWNCWREDIELLKSTGQNAYRFSIEWSRIEPKQGHFDQEAIDHYREILAELRKNSITSMVTLFHFVLPKWAADLGGFLNKNVRQAFANYADIVSKELANLVDLWVTINEPQTYALNGYVYGSWPPEVRNFLKGIQIMRCLNTAHIMSYKKIRANTTNPIGIVQNIAIFEPLTETRVDQKFTQYINDLANVTFIKPIAKYMDFLGINYYYNVKIQKKEPQFHFLSRKKTDLGWNIYQEGLYHVIMMNQIWGKPIYITENGLADESDRYRPEFIRDAFKYLKKAIDKGADVRGYFHWTLLDNFEWAHGYTAKFGLFTRDRKPRPSAEVYKELIEKSRAS